MVMEITVGVEVITTDMAATNEMMNTYNVFLVTRISIYLQDFFIISYLIKYYFNLF